MEQPNTPTTSYRVVNTVADAALLGAFQHGFYFLNALRRPLCRGRTACPADIPHSPAFAGLP